MYSSLIFFLFAPTYCIAGRRQSATIVSADPRGTAGQRGLLHPWPIDVLAAHDHRGPPALQPVARLHQRRQSGYAPAPSAQLCVAP